MGSTGEILATAFRGGLAYGANIVPLAMPFGRDDAGFTPVAAAAQEVMLFRMVE